MLDGAVSGEPSRARRVDYTRSVWQSKLES